MIKNEIGNRYGRLVVIERRGQTKGRQALWKCVCDCGIEVITQGASLRNGHTSSCGCLQREETSKARKTHGMRFHPAYKVYLQARARCQNPKNKSFKNYGGRGIEFRFKTFEEFWGCLGSTWVEGLSIERGNNEGHYEAGNVKWATTYEQLRNQRSNIWIEFNGKSMVLADWSRELGISKPTLSARYKLFGSDPDKLFSPVNQAMSKARCRK